MANITHLYKGSLSSSAFNKRFADILGGSVLSGFYFGLGTRPNAISLLMGRDASSLLVTEAGVRIEEINDVINAVEVEPNNSADSVRTDAIYAVYEHGPGNTDVTYELLAGDAEGNPPSEPDPVTHTLLGYIQVPTGGRELAIDAFFPVEKGLKLRDISNTPMFRKGLQSIENIVLTASPTKGNHVPNKAYLDDEINKILSRIMDIEKDHYALDAYSSAYNDQKKVFETVEYRRQDETTHSVSKLSGLDDNGNYRKLTIDFYSNDGETVLRTQHWNFEYDQYGNIISKAME